jgi:hypothetical protein
MLGGDFQLQWRDTYLFQSFKIRAGVMNALAVGPIALITGVGVGHAQMSEISVGLDERRLFADDHAYLYWRSDVWLRIYSGLSFSGGIVPRYHFSDDFSGDDLFESWEMHVTVHLFNMQLRFQQENVLSQREHSLFLTFGFNYFD